MGKKDKKSKTAEQKARVAAKQTKKAAQKEKKTKAKGREGDDSDAEDIDLDAVLAEYAKQQAQFLRVTEVSCEPPSPRSSATIIGSPSSRNELFLFGGEYYNGALATFYNDLYIYLTDRDEWRLVTSPNSPLPRSGHAWCRGENAGGVYLFGGEFSSPKQGTFYHYNDFWRLDPSTREWERLETKGKVPPARSGHRMVSYKNYIVLFGGFQDTSQQTKYLQDIWIYDCQNFVWHNPVLPPATQKPDARSSFSFLPHEAGAVIYGGYSRVKATVMAGKQTKGASQGTRTVLKPVIHQDTWFLRIVRPPSDGPGVAPAVRWERRKRPANPPNPARAGVTMAYHKGRGILFGGVHDVEESEEGIESEFFDSLYAWNVDRNRFFQLTLRRPRTAGKKQLASERAGGRRGKGKADEEDLLRNLAALRSKGSISEVQDIEKTEAPDDEADLQTKPTKEVTTQMPHPRFNAQLAVQDDVLYILGGTFERGDREYTFDEMWAVDLGKLDGVKEIYRRELENWEGSEAEDSEDDEDDEDMDTESEDESNTGGITMQDGSSTEQNPLEAPVVAIQDGTPATTAALDETASDAESTLSNSRPHPRPFETLRDFYTRTSDAWQNILLDEQKRNDSSVDDSIKELRKRAFDLAEVKWWDCREEIRALEDEQEEAGIGEVVSLADRSSGVGATSRRR